jgi:hypothetical protein
VLLQIPYLRLYHILRPHLYIVRETRLCVRQLEEKSVHEAVRQAPLYATAMCANPEDKLESISESFIYK